MRLARTSLLVAIFLLQGSLAAQPQNLEGFAVFGYKPDSARALFEEIKSAFRSKDLDRIGRLSSAPFTFIIQDFGSRPGIEIYNRDDLYKNRDRILSKVMLDAVERMDFPKSIATSRGISFGNGTVYVDYFCPANGRRVEAPLDPCRPRAVLRIFTLNEPYRCEMMEPLASCRRKARQGK